ncbi:uncharacterized protein ACA1_045940 [Acanthamoeba castellanii str. Neff]|uniref:Uncharacterized protein n=1 Tax=Acanthamoeba castellanii (strain ATCC 30010 / Neff) TaxID=1257118 RepID=L8HBW6_ACACF|nr:uncharacterized protein ACA1_045940 [Acanthamoeba castellanii str. Neff]ELR21896.1 hypothetical protein ACA1_045940 [Acanthamoeba castellanii str. Neff]
MVLRIQTIRKRLANNYSISISLTHIPSHIDDKKAAAKRNGPDALYKLELKIKELELLLPSKINQYFNGNEKADKLAKEGIDMPPVIAKWEIQTGSEQATIFNLEGVPIEGGIPAYAQTVRTEARRWLTKQTIYADQLCPSCGSKETQDHALSEQCALTLASKTALATTTQNIIATAANANNNHSNRLPPWYGSAVTPALDVSIPHFDDLSGYDHTLGKTGHVPKALPKALAYFGITGSKAEDVAVELCAAVLAHHHELWRKRCSLLYEPTTLKKASDKAFTETNGG